MNRSTFADILKIAVPAIVALVVGLGSNLLPALQSVKTWVKIVGFLLLVLLAAYLVFLQRLIEKSPHGTAVFQKGNEILFGYDKTRQQLTLKFGGALSTRDREVWISDMSASLYSGSEEMRQIFPFAFEDFSCAADSKEIRTPFAVRDDNPVPISCTLASQLPRGRLEALLGPGEHRLSVRLKSDSGNFTEANYCFELDQGVTEELKAGSGTPLYRFLYPDCQEVEKP
jgi:hypothetical protein